MTPTVDDIIKLMNGLAPPKLAEEWDNVGLQAGSPDWPVRRTWLALDPLPSIVSAACRANVDLLITHHPLFLKPIKKLDYQTPQGAIISLSVQHRLAIFSAHTNLDSVGGGINDVLADYIGLNEIAPMQPPAWGGGQQVKLVVFVPREFEEKVLEVLFRTPAGTIGSYTCCSFLIQGEGTFRPGRNAKPFIGEVDQITRTPEVRIEIIVPRDAVREVIHKVRDAHPYETMAYDIYPLAASPETESVSGLGRVGVLRKAVGLEKLAMELKTKIGAATVRFAGPKDLKVKKVAVCSGSGASLLRHFFDSGADVFVSGDFRYHDTRAIEEAGRGLIDLGHFASEHIILPPLARKLEDLFKERNYEVSLTVCELESDPFRYI